MAAVLCKSRTAAGLFCRKSTRIHWRLVKEIFSGYPGRQTGHHAPKHPNVFACTTACFDELLGMFQ